MLIDDYEYGIKDYYHVYTGDGYDRFKMIASVRIPKDESLPQFCASDCAHVEGKETKTCKFFGNRDLEIMKSVSGRNNAIRPDCCKNVFRLTRKELDEVMAKTEAKKAKNSIGTDFVSCKRYHTYTDVFYDKDFLVCSFDDYGNGNEFCSGMCKHMRKKTGVMVCTFFNNIGLYRSEYQGPLDTGDGSPDWLYVRPETCRDLFKLTEDQIDTIIKHGTDESKPSTDNSGSTFDATDIGTTTVTPLHGGKLPEHIAKFYNVSDSDPEVIVTSKPKTMTATQPSKYTDSKFKQQQRAELLNAIVSMAGNFDYSQHNKPQDACILFIKKVFYETVTLLDHYSDIHDSK